MVNVFQIEESDLEILMLSLRLVCKNNEEDKAN